MLDRDRKKTKKKNEEERRRKKNATTRKSSGVEQKKPKKLSQETFFSLFLSLTLSRRRLSLSEFFTHRATKSARERERERTRASIVIKREENNTYTRKNNGSAFEKEEQ